MSRRQFDLTAVAVLAATVLAACMSLPRTIRGQKDADNNPYLAAKGLSTAELADYLERMQRKPKTIKKRRPFIDAVVDASKRVLNAKPNDEQRKRAALALFESLHRIAVLDDNDADAELMHWAAKLKDDSVKEIAAAAGLHLWEKRVMDARKDKELSEEDAAKLLSELNEYLSKEKLARQHLRLCSETIGLINDFVKDKAEANKLYDKFGRLFAKSDDRDVSRYGEDIVGPEDPFEGKTLEITGKTVDGEDFDIKSYQGKVVLVDFWATWCGPCVAEMPNVKANYEKYHERGFEIVGISLDRDREKLEQFIKDNKIPWVNLFEDGQGLHPMAKKYGVRAIPTAILVGKDGKVVSSRARGATLGKLLAKLLK